MRHRRPRAQPVNPLNLDGATKKANELMTQAYAHLFNTIAEGVRRFVDGYRGYAV